MMRQSLVHDDDIKIRNNRKEKGRRIIEDTNHKAAMLTRAMVAIESFNHKSKISSVLNAFMIF